MRKKAMEMMFGVIIAAVIAGVIIFLVFFANTDTFSKFWTYVTQKKGYIEKIDCDPNNPFNKGEDKDGDGCPDTKDVCLGTGPGIGDNLDDDDGDGMPRDCDYDDDDPTVNNKCKEYQRCKWSEGKVVWLNFCCTAATGIDVQGRFGCAKPKEESTWSSCAGSKG